MDLQLFLFNALGKKFDYIKSKVSPNDCHYKEALEERINGKKYIDKNFTFYVLDKIFPHVESVRSKSSYKRRVKKLLEIVKELIKEFKKKNKEYNKKRICELHNRYISLYELLGINKLLEIPEGFSKENFIQIGIKCYIFS